MYYITLKEHFLSLLPLNLRWKCHSGFPTDIFVGQRSTNSSGAAAGAEECTASTHTGGLESGPDLMRCTETENSVVNWSGAGFRVHTRKTPSFSLYRTRFIIIEEQSLQRQPQRSSVLRPSHPFLLLHPCSSGLLLRSRSRCLNYLSCCSYRFHRPRLPRWSCCLLPNHSLSSACLSSRYLRYKSSTRKHHSLSRLQRRRSAVWRLANMSIRP